MVTAVMVNVENLFFLVEFFFFQNILMYFVCICVCPCMCTHTCVCVPMRVHTSMCVSVCVHACAHIHVEVREQLIRSVSLVPCGFWV